MNMIVETFKHILYGMRMMTDEEYYYSQSVDMADLEKRMREVQRGQAPFQRHR